MDSGRARNLRKNLTEAEKRLWWRLRRRQVQECQFRRQAPIGNYVVDFVCFAKRLIIELDGGQHANRRNLDEARTLWLESQGFRVLRFWNNDIFDNVDGVLSRIEQALIRENPPPP